VNVGKPDNFIQNKNGLFLPGGSAKISTSDDSVDINTDNKKLDEIIIRTDDEPQVPEGYVENNKGILIPKHNSATADMIILNNLGVSTIGDKQTLSQLNKLNPHKEKFSFLDVLYETLNKISESEKDNSKAYDINLYLEMISDLTIRKPVERNVFTENTSLSPLVPNRERVAVSSNNENQHITISQFTLKPQNQEVLENILIKTLKSGLLTYKSPQKRFALRTLSNLNFIANFKSDKLTEHVINTLREEREPAALKIESFYLTSVQDTLTNQQQIDILNSLKSKNLLSSHLAQSLLINNDELKNELKNIENFPQVTNFNQLDNVLTNKDRYIDLANNQINLVSSDATFGIETEIDLQGNTGFRSKDNDLHKNLEPFKDLVELGVDFNGNIAELRTLDNGFKLTHTNLKKLYQVYKIIQDSPELVSFLSNHVHVDKPQDFNAKDFYDKCLFDLEPNQNGKTLEVRSLSSANTYLDTKNHKLTFSYELPQLIDMMHIAGDIKDYKYSPETIVEAKKIEHKYNIDFDAALLLSHAIINNKKDMVPRVLRLISQDAANIKNFAKSDTEIYSYHYKNADEDNYIKNFVETNNSKAFDNESIDNCPLYESLKNEDYKSFDNFVTRLTKDDKDFVLDFRDGLGMLILEKIEESKSQDILTGLKTVLDHLETESDKKDFMENVLNYSEKFYRYGSLNNENSINTLQKFVESYLKEADPNLTQGLIDKAYKESNAELFKIILNEIDYTNFDKEAKIDFFKDLMTKEVNYQDSSKQANILDQVLKDLNKEDLKEILNAQKESSTALHSMSINFPADILSKILADIAPEHCEELIMDYDFRDKTSLDRAFENNNLDSGMFLLNKLTEDMQRSVLTSISGDDIFNNPNLIKDTEKLNNLLNKLPVSQRYNRVQSLLKNQEVSVAVFYSIIDQLDDASVNKFLVEKLHNGENLVQKTFLEDNNEIFLQKLSGRLNQSAIAHHLVGADNEDFLITQLKTSSVNDSMLRLILGVLDQKDILKSLNKKDSNSKETGLDQIVNLEDTMELVAAKFKTNLKDLLTQPQTEDQKELYRSIKRSLVNKSDVYLNILSKFSEDDQINILTSIDSEGLNMIQKAILKNPQELESILLKIPESLIKEVLLHKNNDDENSFDLAFKNKNFARSLNNPIKLYDELLFSKFNQNEIEEIILKPRVGDKHNLLSYAVDSQNYELTRTLIDRISPEKRKAALLLDSGLGRNPQEIAKSHKCKYINSLFKTIV
jgi:hypothetical protein